MRLATTYGSSPIARAYRRSGQAETIHQAPPRRVTVKLASKPARFVVVAQLREAFRDSSPDTLAARREHFNQDCIRRTVWFLNVAAREKGLEHKIVKGLVHTVWSRRQAGSKYKSLLHVKAQKKAREGKGR